MLHCSQCWSRSFSRISEVVQHVEAVDCKTIPNTPSRKNLLHGLKKKLRYAQGQQKLDKFRCELRSRVGRLVLVRDTEVRGDESRR